MPTLISPVVEAAATKVFGGTLDSVDSAHRQTYAINEQGGIPHAAGENKVTHTLFRNKQANWLGIEWPGLKLTPLRQSKTLPTHFCHAKHLYFPFGPASVSRRLTDVPYNVSPLMALAKLDDLLMPNKFLLQPTPPFATVSLSTQALMVRIAARWFPATPALTVSSHKCASAEQLQQLFEELGHRTWMSYAHYCIVRHDGQYHNLERLEGQLRLVDYTFVPARVLPLPEAGAEILYYHPEPAAPVLKMAESKHLLDAGAFMSANQMEMARRMEATHIVATKDGLPHLLQGDLGKPHPHQIFWPGLGWQILREDDRRNPHFDMNGMCYFPLDFATQKKLMHLPLQAGLFIAVVHLFDETLADFWPSQDKKPLEIHWEEIRGLLYQKQPISVTSATKVLQAAADHWRPQQLRLHDGIFTTTQLKSRADNRARNWHDKHLGCLIVESKGSYFVLEKHSQGWELVDYTFVPARLYPLDGSSNYYAFSFDVLP